MAVDSSAKYTGPTLVPTGQYAGQPGIQLRRPVYVIGSRADARIHLKSSTVSRAHAILVQTRHETYIRDLASRNGVFVNGKQIREAVLKHGDLIGVGKFTFQYQANHISHGSEPPITPAAVQVSGGEFPIPIEGRVMLIGRRQGCDIQLTEETASSSHAVILQWEGLRFIRDLGSRTGTFVNGQAVHEIQLNPNDRIRIGETDIVYSPSLEEAAFDLISDASDSMIAKHPVAEEVNVSPHAEPEGTPAAPIVPHSPIAEIELEPISHEALPLEEVAAKDEPVQSEPIEELPPLELESVETAAEETVEAAAEKDESHDQDLVTLAGDEAEPLPLEATPHDTAHIPLAVKQAEPPIESAEEIPTHNAVVDASLQSPVGSVDMAGGGEPLSATEIPAAENLSEPVAVVESPQTEIPVAEAPTEQADESVENESGVVESDGLELLDESGIPPFTPVSPEPLAAEIGDEADLPRRGWRSGIVEPTVPAEVESEPAVEAETKIEMPVEEAKVSEPEVAEPEIAEPEIAEPETTQAELSPAEAALFEEAQPQISEPSAAEPVEPQGTDDVLQFADEQTSTEEPIARGDAVIDLSALLPGEEVPESVEVSSSEPNEEPVADLGVDVESAEPATAQPFDLSSVDFTAPEKTIADLANEAPVVQAAPVETPVETPVESPANVVEEIPAEPAVVETAAPAVVDEPPVEMVPDEFIPSGEVSADELPADDGESLSSFKSRRREMRGKAARSRRPKIEAVQPVADETIEPTEPTPQSALDLPAMGSAVGEVAEPPALPLVDVTAGLSDTTFGKAVQEFEGESTGPIVEGPVVVEAPVVEAPIVEQPAAEVSRNDAEPEPIEFAEAQPETVAPNFHSENPDAPEVAQQEITDSESVEVPAAHVPLFDANTIEDSVPSDLNSAPHPEVQRPLELPKSDFVGVDNTYVVPEPSSAPVPPPVSSSLDLSKLEAEAETSVPLDESVISDVLSEPPTESGQATTDATSELPPPSVVRSDDAQPVEPQPDEARMGEVHPMEMPAGEAHPAQAVPGDVEIDGADVDGMGANQTHYLGGEPLDLKEGVHPPEGFGEVSVDFSRPPGATKDEAAPLKQESQPALPEDHDILPPEAGDAVVPTAPAALASLTTLAGEVAAVGVAADPFLIDRAMPRTGINREIPAFGLAGTPTLPQPQQPEPPAANGESDAPLQSIGKGKGRRARVIRNGFGQNPDAPKGDAVEASPFADNAGSMSGLAIDSIAAPAMPDMDVFSELPPGGEKAELPRGKNEVGQDVTADAWMKTSTGTRRSRRRTTAIPAIPIGESVGGEINGSGGVAVGGSVGGVGAGPEGPGFVLEDENRANAAAQRRSRLLKRVPILCGAMVALIGVAVTVCALCIPVRQQVQATMSYRNFDSLTHEEQLHFQADQDRKLHQDGTRMLAKTKLQNRHPKATAGFLDNPEQFASLSLEWPESRAGEPGIAWINYQSADTAVDPLRVQAVAQAMFDENSDLTTAAESIKQSMDKLASDIASEARQIEEDKNKRIAEQAFQDGRPTLAELARLKDDDATLEAAYKDAMDKVVSAQAAVDQLKKEHAAESKPVAPGTDPVAADAQIQQMGKDADALNAKIAAARKERADLASKARATLDSAYDEFKKQMQDSQNVTKDNPQLAAYVTAAQNLQQAIHQLTDEYIQKQQEEYTQLNQMKSSLVAKIQQRQADLFADDSQLKQLNDQKEILTRKYNEAINSGLDKDASDLKNDLQLNDTATKARKEIISNDPVYTELLNDMQQLIDQKQHSIDEQRKNTDQQLATMKEQFEKSAPTVEQLPAEQKQFAAAMQDKLAQIDAARKQYAEAADASVADSDSSIQQMQNDLQTLQTNLETRKRQVAEANSAAARKARDDQFNADLSQKTAGLDQLNKAAAMAQAAYQANHAKLVQRESVADQINASEQRLEKYTNDEQALEKQKEQHQMAWDQKNSEYDAAVEPLEPEAQAHLVGSPVDNRVLYAGVSSGAIVVVFLIAICWTVIGAAREGQHAYVPAFESMERPGPGSRGGNKNGNGVHQEEGEEERAAVA